ncbi:hypothetical protein ON010_g11585 [Phytophthora cinnamomi]|nr:hypothetical protein ON010_g11585 [Phytophthora cinnamomi]
MLIAELKVLEGAVNVLAEAETPLEAIKTLVTTVDKALLIKMAAFRSVEWPQMVVVSEKVFAVTDAWLESMMQRCPSMCASVRPASSVVETSSPGRHPSRQLNFYLDHGIQGTEHTAEAQDCSRVGLSRNESRVAAGLQRWCEPPERGLRLIDQVALRRATEQSKAAGAEPRFTMNPYVYSQLMTMTADMEASIANVDAARLEAEQCVRRLTAMMQTELSPQERARLEESKLKAMELEQLKHQTVARQQDVGEL